MSLVRPISTYMGLYIGPLTKLGSWKRLIASSIRQRVGAMRA